MPDPMGLVLRYLVAWSELRKSCLLVVAIYYIHQGLIQYVEH
jgi:hypothetical protein